MRVSVVIPSYEAGLLLSDAVDSVRSQQGFILGQDAEVIIADDGSTRADSAHAIAAVAEMRGVRVVKTMGRTGPSAARNLAARHARGQWLSFLDADDLYAPDALAVRWQVAQEAPVVGCVVTDYAEFPADTPFTPEGLTGVIASTPRRRPAVQPAVDDGHVLILDRPVLAFLRTVPMWTGSVFVRRDAFESLGGFPEGHHIGEDLHLWLRIAATQRLAYVPRITAYCRKGHASLTTGETAMNLKTTRCFENLLQDPVMHAAAAELRAVIAEGYLSESYFSRQAGQNFEALVHAWSALRWQPWKIANWWAFAKASFPTRTAISPQLKV